MKALRLILLLFATSFITIFNSCNRDSYEPLPDSGQVRRVFIMYVCGYNNLSSDIYGNLQELCGTVPGNPCQNLPYRRYEHFQKVLIFSHLTREAAGGTRDDSDYTTPCAPVLIDAYLDDFGRPVMDTVKLYPENTVSASAATMHDVLSYIKSEYPAAEYDMVLSSHGTGWLPAGYYAKQEELYFAASPSGSPREFVLPPSSYLHPLEGPEVKSMTAQYSGTSGNLLRSDEIEICDFAEALPMHLHCLILDLCLMGGIEMAYELAGKVDLLAFSQTEILAAGMCYDTMLKNILFSKDADMVAVCEDYYQKCTGNGSEGVVSLVDCNRLDRLAEVCSRLLSDYGEKITSVDPYEIQEYFRGNKHWFYDLKDIFVKSGVPRNDIAELDAALNDCVLYKAATPRFLFIPIENHCGLSMYLPSKGDSYLNGFYRDFRWNKATSLVK